MADQLVQVVSTGPRPDGAPGWIDTLACGHVLAFTGERRAQRRCAECGPFVPVRGTPQPTLC